jgi:hypothetical protein
MHVSIIKGLRIFQNFFGIVFGFARERFKRPLLIKYRPISAGNMLPASCGLSGPL